MTGIWRRWARRTAPAFLAIGLFLSPTLSVPARAQEDMGMPGQEKSEGRPLDGYLGTTCLLLLLFFIVGKSARR